MIDGSTHRVFSTGKSRKIDSGRRDKLYISSFLLSIGKDIAWKEGNGASMLEKEHDVRRFTVILKDFVTGQPLWGCSMSWRRDKKNSGANSIHN